MEIIGMVIATPSTEVDHQPIAGTVDPEYVSRLAKAHEAVGSNKVLVGYFSNGAEGSVVSSFICRPPGQKANLNPTVSLHWISNADMTVGPVDPQAARDFRETADFLHQTGTLPSAFDIQKVIDPSFSAALEQSSAGDRNTSISGTAPVIS